MSQIAAAFSYLLDKNTWYIDTSDNTILSWHGIGEVIPTEGGMDLFEYVVVFTGDDEWEGAEIIDRGTMLSPSEETARMRLIRDIPAEYDELLDDITIHIRKWRA